MSQCHAHVETCWTKYLSVQKYSALNKINRKTDDNKSINMRKKSFQIV